MELKTKKQENTTLYIIAAEAEKLVSVLTQKVNLEGIKTGRREAINEGEAKSIVAAITDLGLYDVNGNEDLLDDKITIYDAAIKSIEDALAKNAELEDGHMDKFNKGAIDSFNAVRKVLEESKNSTVQPLKDALDKLVEEKVSGKIEQEYKEIKIEEIEVEESSIQDEIKDTTESLNKFEFATKKEREDLDSTVRLSEEYFKTKKEIEELDKALADPNLSDEGKGNLESKKAKKEQELASVFKKFDEKYEKDDNYKQKENESGKDYLARIQMQDGIADLDMNVKFRITLKQGDLQKKIETLKGQTVKVYDEVAKEFKEIKIEDYVDANDLNNLSKKIKSDRLLNREGLKKQRDRLDELKKEKEDYKEIDDTLVRNDSKLPAKVTKGMGFWEKVGRRSEYYQNNGDSKFKAFFKGFFNRGKDDQEVFAKDIKQEKIPNNLRREFLKQLEKGIKTGGKNKAIRDIKSDLFAAMDKENEEMKKSGEAR